MPPVETSVADIAVDSKRVICIRVESSQHIVATIEGKTLRRCLKHDGAPETVAFYPMQYANRLSTLRHYDYSSQCLSNACMEDLDSRESDRLRELIRKGNEKELDDLDDEALYKALGIASEATGTLRPTVTGLLLIGKAQRLQELLPTARATLQVLRGTKLIINEHSARPILETMENFEKNFRYYNTEDEFQHGLLRVGVPAFSPIAFREALVNAFCHRDYAILGDVRLVINDEELMISSHGGFIEGVGVHNILTVEPMGRNPSLALALKRIGLAEKSGRGIDRIFEGSINYGRPWPDYSGSSSQYVKVSILRAKPDMAFHALLERCNSTHSSPLSISALMILSALKEYRRLNIAKLAVMIQITENRVRSVVERLVEMGLVEATGSGNTRDYILSRDVYVYENNLAAYEKQLKSSVCINEEMILQYAEEHEGTFTSNEVAEFLGIERTRVTRIINLLVKEEKLKKLGNRRGARYYLASLE